MGKYSLTQNTIEDVRASKSFMLEIPDHAQPQPDAPWAQLPKDQKVGPFKWTERVRVAKCEVDQDEDKEGNPRDILRPQFEILDGPNEGRTISEFWYLREPADGESFDKMTRFSLANLDSLVTAALGKGAYVLDDNGAFDPIATFTDALPNTEVVAKISQGVKWNKRDKEWREECTILEFHEVE